MVKRTKSKRVVVRRKSGKKAAREIGLLGQALRGLGSLGGGAIGALVGHPGTGAAVGNSFGATVSKWLGAGDYSVSKNTVVQRASSSIPAMHNTSQNVVIRHKEFIGTIFGSSDFKVQGSYPINPGIPTTFPWLATIASRFQEYEIKGMVYHYVPTSGVYSSAGTALGAVMMQTSYRTTDSAPTSKMEMLNEYWASETVPSESMVHPIECDPKENPFAVHYVRTVTITSGEPLMYDLGRTFVCTQGMPSAGPVGDLWVTYEVELKKPLISSAVTTAEQYFATSWQSPTTLDYFGGQRNTSVGRTDLTFSRREIYFPSGSTGTYVVTIGVKGDGYMVGAPTTQFSAPSRTNLNTATFDGTHFELDDYNTATSGNAQNRRLTFIGAYSVIDSTSEAFLSFPTTAFGIASGDAEFLFVTITHFLI